MAWELTRDALTLAAIVVGVGLPIAAIAYGVSGNPTVLRRIGAAITWILALIGGGLTLVAFLLNGTVLCGDNECHTAGAAARAAVVTVLLVILGFVILKAGSRDSGRGRKRGSSSGRTGGSEAPNTRGLPHLGPG